MLEVLRELPKDQVVGTPESVARQRRIADALLAQGSDTSPIQSWTQGAARVAQALAGVYREHKADSAEQAGQASDKANLAALIGGAFGGGSTGAASPTASAAPTYAPAAPAAATEGHGGASRDPAVMAEIRRGAVDAGKALGVDPADLLTTVSYETGGTFDPWKAGPTTQWGQHRGLIQWGEPQRAKYGVTDKTSPYDQMLAAAQYLKDTGVKPGMGLMDIYSAVNAGGVGRYGASDANNGGAPGTVADKVNKQMAAHRAAAMALLGPQDAAPQVAPAGVQVASADPNFAPQMSSPAGITDAPVPGMPPAGPGASLSPQDMATLAQRYAQAAPPPSPAAGITDAPVTTGARPLTPADNFTERFNAGDPNALKPMALPPGAAVAPPAAPPQAPMPPPAMTGTVAPPAAVPPQAAAAMQGAPPGAKDSIIQSMIARGINPANGQPLQNPGIGRVAQAMMAGGGAPQTVPAVNPAVQRVAGAMAPQSPPQATGGAVAPAGPQGANPRVAAAVQALANPYASAASKFMAQKIISDEMESRDPLRQLQVQKLQLELGGGTKDEQRMRQLQIQKAEKELAAPPKQWQKLDDSTLYDPATGETKRVDAGPAGAAIFKGTSVEAQSLNGLVTAGKLTPEQAMQIGAGKTVTDPSTGAVIFMTPDGIFGQRPGQPPQPLSPPGASPQGAPAAPAPQQNPGMIPITAPKPVKASESEKNAMTYADRMQQSGAILDALGTKGTGLQDQIFSQVPLVGNSMVSEDFQKVDQAKRDFINAQLRRESGAAISQGEFESANKQYFPQRGDTEDVIAQKAQNRKTVIQGMIRDGGVTYQPQPAAPAPTPAPPQKIVPPVGTIESGYRFKGGDPSDARNWEKAE